MTVLSALAIGVFVLAAASDIARRRISNRLVVALALIGLLRLAIGIAGGDGVLPAAADIGAALAVFGVGAVLHHFGFVGGGDVKLLAAATLWLGAGQFGGFLTLTAIAGGALALGFLACCALRPAARPSLPYGVAIAFAGVWGTLTAL